MPRPRSIYAEDETPKLKIAEENNTMQQVHTFVRTVTKQGVYGDHGEVPAGEADAELTNKWLSQGWKIVSAFLVGRNDEVFEIAYILVKDIVVP